MAPDAVFKKPTSIIIFGNDRPLLNWVAYALATINDPGFIWTEVQARGQLAEETDPTSRKVIPPERSIVRRPSELALSNSVAHVAVSTVIRGDEPPENIRRLLEFLRLPAPTQQVLSSPRPDHGPRVVVLSNSHRIASLYPSIPDVATTIRTILESDSTIIMTFADAPTEGRAVFDTVLHVEGSVRDGWRNATVKVERGPKDAGFEDGTELRLADFPPIAKILARDLG